MSAPDAAAPCGLLIDGLGRMICQITDHRGEILEYALEVLPPGLDDFALRLARIDGQDGPYLVRLEPSGRWRCNCADTTFGRPRRELRSCKHRYAAQKLHLALVQVHPNVHVHEEEEAR